MDTILKNGVFAPRSSYWLPAAIGAVGGLASTIVGGSMSRRAAKEYNKGQIEIAQMNNEWNANEALKNREWQEQMVNSQNQWNLDQWNRENEYNSPAAQRQRLEDAGLNPYLMMDGGNAGVASSVSAASPSGGSQAAPAQMPQQQALRYDFSGIADAINSYFSNRKVAAETTGQNMRNDVFGLYGKDLALAQINQGFNGELWKLNPVARNYMINNGREYAELGLSSLRNQVQSQRIVNDMNVAHTTKIKAEVEGQRLLNQFYPAKAQGEILALSAQAAELFARGELNRAQVSKTIAEEARAIAEAQGLQLKNKIFSRIGDYYADAAIEAYKSEAVYSISERPYIANREAMDYRLTRRHYEWAMNDYDQRMRHWNQIMQYDVSPLTGALGQILGGAGLILPMRGMFKRSPRPIGFGR